MDTHLSPLQTVISDETQKQVFLENIPRALTLWTWLLVDVQCDGSLVGKDAAAQVNWGWLGCRTYSGPAIEASAFKTILHTYYKCVGHLSRTYTIRRSRCLARFVSCSPSETVLSCTHTADDDH